MEIRSLVIIHYGGDPSGNLEVTFEGGKSTIELSKFDAQQVLSLAELIYERCQQRIAEEFARPLPALAHFTEATDA